MDSRSAYKLGSPRPSLVTLGGGTEPILVASSEELGRRGFASGEFFNEKILSAIKSPLRGMSSEKVSTSVFYNFIEMDILVKGKTPQDPRVWKEVTRWIKYEQNLGASLRWSKPHISAITFQSIAAIRRLIETEALMLLKMQDTTYPSIVSTLADELEIQNKISAVEKFTLTKVLLLKRKHASTGTGWVGNLRKNSILQNFYELGKGDEIPDGAVNSNAKASSTPRSSNASVSILSGGKVKKRRNSIKGEAAVVLISHKKLPLGKTIFAIIQLDDARVMKDITELPVPVRFFCILLVPGSTIMGVDVKEVGRALGSLFSNKDFYDLAVLADGKEDFLRSINSFVTDSIVIPPGIWDNEDLLLEHHYHIPESEELARRESVESAAGEQIIEETEIEALRRTKKPFGGMIQELRQRYSKYYRSDYTDALHFQCIAATIFLYLASIGPVITFGGLYGTKTDNLIGISENLAGFSICSVFYTLVAAQPLIPLGVPGLLLILDEIIFNVCRTMGIKFLAFRTWIGVWQFIIFFIVTATEGTFLVKYATRFVQDIYAFLTSFFLIWESVAFLLRVYSTHPIGSSTNTTTVIDCSYPGQPNVALFSTLLMMGTISTVLCLRAFRQSYYLGAIARQFLGDFAIPIAVALMVMVDQFFPNSCTEKPNVPVGFTPTDPTKRGWFINPIDTGINPTVAAFSSIVPGFLVAILIFLNHEICGVQVASNEYLRKGSGVHADLFFIAVVNMGCAFLGLPFQCASFVRSFGHIDALTVYTKNNPPGEKPTVVTIYEQRVTNLVNSILIGISILLGPILIRIPLVVFFGVLFYLGIFLSIGTQFYQRLTLLFTPVSGHPQVIYVRDVETWKMHLFTIIQLTCLAILCAILRIPYASLAFPLLVILLIPLRFKLLPYFYTEDELYALDGKPGRRRVKIRRIPSELIQKSIMSNPSKIN